MIKILLNIGVEKFYGENNNLNNNNNNNDE
jgi:hypothetical protein